MATVSVREAGDSGSREQDAASLRFQRLARVRARQRARRRGRLILIALLVATLAGVSVLGFTTARGTSSERAGDARSGAGIGTPARPIEPSDAPSPVEVTLPPRPLPATPPSTPTRGNTPSGAPPVPPTVGPVARESALPRTTTPAVGRSSAPETDERDATAAIDWLLKTRSQ
jgi:hypothetical protein